MKDNVVPLTTQSYDVIVVGSGAGGLATAVTAAAMGLKVLVLEKEPYFGGTTARSGGVLWVPGNGKFPAGEQPQGDARAYLQDQTGTSFDASKVDAFLDAGPKMVRFMEMNTRVRFIPAHGFSDYHPSAPGACTTGRSIAAEPYDGRELGKEISRLRPPLAEITLLGMMLNASQDVKHFFNAAKSPASAWHVTKLLSRYAFEMAVYQRPMRLTNGNALIARLAGSAFDLGVEIWTDASVIALKRVGDRISGVFVNRNGRKLELSAQRGVVLACGGFPLDKVRTKELFPHVANGDEHLSPAAPGNTGDGLRLGESVGGKVRSDISDAAAWIPMSKVPDKKGKYRVFPHLIDRYKPGVIAVDLDGNRFTNESDSYHDYGRAMLKHSKDRQEVSSWLLCDHRSLRKYGLGHVKPFPFPIKSCLDSGYLKRGESLSQLARVIGVPEANLEATVSIFNKGAQTGKDNEFGRGESAYNRFLGDPEQQPNPCVAPIKDGPFYAIKMKMGDLGTFAGLDTDECSRVLNAQRQPIAGLFAVGNDALSIMGGNYPGGGITLGPAMTFGFIIAQHLATQDDWEIPTPLTGPDLDALSAQ
jgi:hypothetical protein